MSSFNCPPFPIALPKLPSKKVEIDSELAFSAASRQHPTKIYSEESWAVSGTVRLNSMRQSSSPR
jgi:hypothetical protein